MSRTGKDVIAESHGEEARGLKRQLDAAKRRIKALEAHADKLTAHTGGRPAPKPRKRKVSTFQHVTRLVIPDSHGLHVDLPARDAMLGDLEDLDVGEVVLLGDHLDAGGTFSAHQRNYTNEMTESYADDVSACNGLLDELQKRCPNATYDYLEGNHEAHIERWASREFHSHRDAVMAVDRLGPTGVLDLKRRGIAYHRSKDFHDGLSVPGTIKRGKCHFVHGMTHARHAAASHLRYVGGNIVFGHCHRVQMASERNVANAAYGAWCPGTLAKLQPLYRHTTPTDWQHGYGLQFVNGKTGSFVHFQVPLVDGVSLLRNVVDALGVKR